MAVTQFSLVADKGTNSAPTSKSFTAHANRLILAACAADTGNTSVALSGLGITWVNIANLSITGPRTLTLFRAMPTSDTTGPLTMTWTDTNVVAPGWSVNEFDGVNTSGTNGSGAVVQNATNTAGSAVTTIAATLAAFASSNNATFGCFGTRDPVGGWTPGSGFTALDNINLGSGELASEWRSDNSTTVGSSWSSGFDTQAGVIGIEIAAGGGPDTPELFEARMFISVP